jgi:hypothetical protein
MDLHILSIFRPAHGADGFLSRTFVDVAASSATVFVPFQVFDVKVRGTTNGTHASSPHVFPYYSDQKKVVLKDTGLTGSLKHRAPEWPAVTSHPECGTLVDRLKAGKQE